MNRDQSSLDRFLQQRAQFVMTGAFGLNSLVVQQVIGLICAIAGVGMAIASYVTHQPELMAAATGPLVAGGVNVAVPRILRRKLGQGRSTDATMTPEARAFLLSLLRRVSGWGIGWPDAHPMSRLYERRIMRRIAIGAAFGATPKSAKDVLDPHLFDLLENACREYNRVLGILETGHTNPTILKSRGRSSSPRMRHCSMSSTRRRRSRSIPRVRARPTNDVPTRRAPLPSLAIGWRRSRLDHSR
jgi:hypothetical protein